MPFLSDNIIITLLVFSKRASFLIYLILQTCRQLLGKDLTGLNLKELQQIEEQLNIGLLSVKERKVWVSLCHFPFCLKKGQVHFCSFNASISVEHYQYFAKALIKTCFNSGTTTGGTTRAIKS